MLTSKAAWGSLRDAGSNSTWASIFFPHQFCLYFLYVDPSGNPELTDHSTSYVVLGVCIHESVWAQLESQTRALRQRFELPELHALALCQQIRGQEQIPDFELMTYQARRSAFKELESAKPVSDARKKKLRQVKDVVHLLRGERSAIFEEALDLVGGQSSVSLFAEVVDKTYAASSELVAGEPKESDIAAKAMTQVLSRFDYFLNRINRSRKVGRQSGLLVMDREPKREDLIRQMVGSFRDHGHPWGKLKNIVETPFFVDSSLASAIQLADLCAYALRRYVEKPSRAGSFEEKNFLRIAERFERSDGKLHGLRHYTRRGSCSCRICQERDHR